MLFELASEVNRTRSVSSAVLLKGLGKSLGLLQQDPAAYLQAGQGIDAAAIEMQIAERQLAKTQRDFARADDIRKALLAQGILLKDGPTGTVWERV
jgi:cysteinyl-tRNA synthetase